MSSIRCRFDAGVGALLRGVLAALSDFFFLSSDGAAPFFLGFKGSSTRLPLLLAWPVDCGISGFTFGSEPSDSEASDVTELSLDPSNSSC